MRILVTLAIATILCSSLATAAPPAIEAEVTKDKIYVYLYGATPITITRQEIMEYYSQQTGTPAQRKEKTIDWVKASISSGDRERLVSVDEINFSIDVSDGEKVLVLELGKT